MSNAQTVGDSDAHALSALAASVRDSFSTVEDMTKIFIRDAILKGIFVPGQRLQQDAIAELLGVSRMPVRASLRQLESEGLVTFHAHRGAAVAVLSAAQIGEIYDLRIMLECYALASAMENLSAEDLQSLEILEQGMEDAGSPAEWLELRERFYGALYAFADRPETMKLIERLRTFVGPYLLLRRVVTEPHAHDRILEYIRIGDSEGAKDWLRNHLHRVSQELQRVVEDEGLQPVKSLKRR